MFPKELYQRGGHIEPISTDGDILKWKNAQKKLTKNITSVNIKTTNPNLIARMYLSCMITEK